MPDQSGTTQSGTTRNYNSPRLIARRSAILQATRDVLTESGFNGVTMQAVAARAGVTRKTLYNVFGTRDELVTAAISEIIDSYRESGLKSEPGIPTILASRQSAIEQFLRNPDYAHAMTSALMQTDADRKLVELLISNSVTFTRQALEEELKAGGLLPETDLEELADQIVSQVWGLILLSYLGEITTEVFERRSTRGLLTLLMGVARDERKDWIARHLDHPPREIRQPQAEGRAT